MVHDVELEVVSFRRSPVYQNFPLHLETTKSLLIESNIIPQNELVEEKLLVKVGNRKPVKRTKVEPEPRVVKIPPLIPQPKTVVEEVKQAETHDIYGDVNKRSPNEFEELSLIRVVTIYIAWLILIASAYLRHFLVVLGIEKDKGTKELEKQKDFVPLYSDFDALYIRRMYIRIKDVFERPIATVPGSTVELLDRVTTDSNWTFSFPGTKTKVVNVSSYNYLGFAQASGPCADSSVKAIEENGLSQCSSIKEFGIPKHQRKLEKLVAEFLGLDDAICCSMGFATNSMNIAALADKNTLIISDERNHTSLILGCRLSGAVIKVFRHNDTEHLEELLIAAIREGNPRTKTKYSKVLIVIEGIYSMEGSICPLPKIIELKKKYKAYLYLDEAHSIGAMGKTGRGVVEYWNCNTKDVDVMMGTFTKSFGSAGGYIAGSKDIIEYLRKKSHTCYYSASMSPPVAQQVLTSMSIIMGKDGTTDGAKRIERLARNSRYFRMKLKQAGLVIYGSDDSPVVPVMTYYPAKCGYFGRGMLERGVGVVVVSYPATEMTEARIRFCISAAHTKDQLDKVLYELLELCENSGTCYSNRKHLYENMKIEW
ncbi:unnamed protein product [Auanema sp. JU1783]|nr:unnamed protein product [Auanema sp. JU1783]